MLYRHLYVESVYEREKKREEGDLMVEVICDRCKKKIVRERIKDGWKYYGYSITMVKNATGEKITFELCSNCKDEIIGKIEAPV